MTGIDSETSQDIAEAISLKGGRYLEAQIQGSKTQAQDGTLVILVSGDRSLFDDCQSCFQAMGKNSFYLGEVGNATKMNLVLQVTTLYFSMLLLGLICSWCWLQLIRSKIPAGTDKQTNQMNLSEDCFSRP